MADVVNLRQARKAKGRHEKEKAAEQNRIRFGRTKSEKLSDKAAKSGAERHIEAHRLNRSAPET